MNNEVTGKVVAVVSDFFATKIKETENQVGAEIECACLAKDMINRTQSRPTLAVLDLNDASFDPILTINQLNEDSSPASVPLVGFVRHEMSALIGLARRTGCGQIFSRNAFARKLPKLLCYETCVESASANE